MTSYKVGQDSVDSVELKCLVISRGLKVDKAVYRAYASQFRLSASPLECNCFLLTDGTVVQLTDMGFHLQYLGGLLSWSQLKLLRYASQLGTPFSLRLHEGRAALFYENQWVDFVSFPPATDFYRQKTMSGLPFPGNAVLQGLDWVAFQCLWPCEYAAAGKPCEFCFSGADFECLAKKGKPLPPAMSTADLTEIVRYATEHTGATSVQLTGGSTFRGEREEGYLREYLKALGGLSLPGEILLYVTPPQRLPTIDDYFSLGADRLACSLEVWDETLAAAITPGKIAYTTRARHLEALSYTAERYGPGKAFSNFIIGLEPFETLRAGATHLAERGIIPTASVWMPMGRPVQGSMKGAELDYFRRVKELFATLYQKFHLEPAGCCGLNVCVERDIWRYMTEHVSVRSEDAI